jgi:hypothetical protein
VGGVIAGLFSLLIVGSLALAYPGPAVLIVVVVIAIALIQRGRDKDRLTVMTPEDRTAEMSRRSAAATEAQGERQQARDFVQCRNCGATRWAPVGGMKLDSLGTPYGRFECGKCGARASLYRHGWGGKAWQYRGH